MPARFVVSSCRLVAGMLALACFFGCAALAVDPLTIVTSALPNATYGGSYSAQISVTGGKPPYQYYATGLSLTKGIDLNLSTGQLLGDQVLGTVGSHSFTVAVWDDSNPKLSVEKSFTITIVAGLQVLSSTLAIGTPGQAYAQSVTVLNGTGPFTFSLESGALPPGLQLNGTSGAITGIPITPGQYQFQVRATDANGLTGVGKLMIPINQLPLTVSPLLIGPIAARVAMAPVAFQASGGTAPYTFVAETGPPPDMVLTNGVLSGSPINGGGGGPLQFSLKTTDANGNTISNYVSITVADFSPQTLAPGTKNVPYSQPLTLSGFPGTPQLSISGTPPPGIGLSGTNVSGTPTAAGSFNFTVQASAGGVVVTRNYTIDVNPAPGEQMVITPAVLPEGIINQPYSQTLGTLFSKPPVTFVKGQGDLPPGLTLAPSGLVSGTPTAGGSYGFDVTATDADGKTAQGSISLAIRYPPLVILPATIPNGEVGKPYSVQFTVTGGNGPFTFTGGIANIPIDTATGLVSGTQLFSGTYDVRITVSNGLQQGFRAYTMAVTGGNTLGMGPLTLPAGTVGYSYNQTIFASNSGHGYEPPVQWQILEGALPPGLQGDSSLGDRLKITGVPNAAGHYAFKVKGTDTAGHSSTFDYFIDIAAQELTILPLTLPSGSQFVPYSAQFTVTGGTAPYTFELHLIGSGVGVPQMNASGLLQFVPSNSGSAGFEVRVTDATGKTGLRYYQVSFAASTLSITPTQIPNGQLGQAYSVTLSGSGGAPPYQFALIAGSLPAGMSLSADGKIAGTPQVAVNSTNITVGVTDSAGASGARSYQFGIQGAPLSIGPESLPPAKGGQLYNAQLSASGGSPPYAFVLSQGTNWPAGVNIEPNGLITGTPPEGLNITATFTVTVTDALGSMGNRQYQLTISSTAVVLTFSPPPPTLPAATLNAPYAAAITASGGKAPYTYSAVGTLPVGLSISTGGQLTGTPTVAGAQIVQVKATDADGAVGTALYQLSVTGGPPQIFLSPDVLPAANRNAAYNVALQASGGQAPYLFSLSDGVLPSGLTLSPAGVLSGTPPQVGQTAFTIRVEDANGAFKTFGYSLAVVASLSLGPDSLPGGKLQTAYSAQLTAAGGVPPYLFSIVSGALPQGLFLSGDGVISGTPSGSAGPVNFDVKVLDTAGATVTRPYQIQIAQGAGPLTIVTSQLPAAQQNSAYSASLTASGGIPPYTWTVPSEHLPAGISLAGNGTLGGSASTFGDFALTVTLTDAAGATVTKQLALHVNQVEGLAALVADPPQLSFASNGNAVAAQCVAVFSTSGLVQVNAALTGFAAGSVTLDVTTLATPGSICVAPQTATMQPGAFQGSLNLSGAGAKAVAVPISITVAAAATEAQPRVSPTVVHVVIEPGGGVEHRSVVVSNDGPQAFDFQAHTASPSWLTLDLIGGTVPAGGSVAVPFALNPASLDADIYTQEISILAGGLEHVVSVELIVSAAPGSLALSQTAIELMTWANGSGVKATTGVVNQGGVALLPLVTASTTDGAAWLSASLADAVVEGGAAAPLTIAANPAGLAAGHYTGLVRVEAAGAANGPQTVAIGLTVLATGSALPAEAAIGGVFLTPGDLQSVVSLVLPPGGGSTFHTLVTGADSSWLQVSPQQGSVPASGGLELTVRASIAGLAAGIHDAVLSVGLSNGIARSIPVTLFVPAVATAAAVRSATSCPGEYFLRILSPVPNFVVREAVPVTVRVAAVRCDGAPTGNLQMVARAGGREFALLRESAAIWSASWIPAQAGTNLKLVASLLGPQGYASTETTGIALANTATNPQVGAVVPTASLGVGNPVALGSWVTIFGTNLAQTASIGPIPLPATLSGVQVFLGDTALPLYYAGPGQVNAVVPRSLNAGIRYQLLLVRDGVPAAPVDTAVVEIQPALFTQNQQGSGQAAALLAGTASLASPATPAAKGSVVEFYATGLGPVSHAPADGAAASTTQLSQVEIPVSATVGGQPAEVLFSGLAPGTVGLYQVNVRIPADVASGDAVTVTLSQKNVTSNVATIAVR